MLQNISKLARTLVAAAAVAGAGACSGGDAGGGVAGPSGTESAPPPIRHVFVIVLENKGYDQTFGATAPSAYLAKTLPQMGQLLTQYYGTAHNSLPNYIGMISGQGPNPQTQADCLGFTDFVGAIPPGSTDGQAAGSGCVYPAGVPTLVDQLEAAHFSWKAYAEDMANVAPATCRHPALNSQDTTQSASKTSQYATRHVPFLYFHSVIDDQARCDAHVVDLGLLQGDLGSVATTPNYVFITPDLCSDGHDATCADGGPGGYAAIDAFLQNWVPKILASPAYQQDGMLLVVFDEAEFSVGPPPSGDATACCNEPTGPNTVAPGITGPGGGRTGTVMLSRYIAPGTVTDTPYNHYSLLRSLEDVFGLGHLGYAAQAGLVPFGADVYTNPTGKARRAR